MKEKKSNLLITSLLINVICIVAITILAYYGIMFNEKITKVESMADRAFDMAKEGQDIRRGLRVDPYSIYRK